MRGQARSFVGGAFFLIALFLVLAHAGGFAQAISAGSTGTASIFKTLQGR
jgi:hypothetical protein